jgi:alginate O-acetyltransferase complex protein AlgI
VLFNSYEFLLIFLPAAWFAYAAAGRSSQHVAIGVLLVFSLVFYAWWSSTFLLLLLASIAFNFLVGRALSSERRALSRRLILVAGLAANLLLLGYFKYADFFVRNVSALIGSDHQSLGIVLPMGISFYTFTQIAFLVDAYRREAREYRPLHYGLFVTYFPHLIAGPILHHKEMMPQFARDRALSAITPEHLSLGFAFLSIGLFKKLVIADSLAGWVTPVFDTALAPSFTEAWIGSLAYTFQLYFDFSGYSDMAIGISLLFGIWLPINFDSPYKSCSIAEFWRRWHMTLSRFLRDYLYIPLGGGRKGGVARSRNLLTTMLLGGLWHGAGWTFVAWGALHGALLVINHLWRDVSARFAVDFSNGRVFAGASWMATFVCVVVGWVIFRAPDLDAAGAILKGMAGLNGAALPARLTEKLGWLPAGWVFAAAPSFPYPDIVQVLMKLAMVSLAVFLLPNSQQILLHKDATRGGRITAEGSLFLGLPTALRALLTSAVALTAIAHISEISPFLYFQF